VLAYLYLVVLYCRYSTWLHSRSSGGLRSKQPRPEARQTRAMYFGDDVMEGAGSDAQRRKKRYHRHTPRQIQQLEAYVLPPTILLPSFVVWWFVPGLDSHG
jgi:hypothetical protein